MLKPSSTKVLIRKKKERRSMRRNYPKSTTGALRGFKDRKRRGGEEDASVGHRAAGGGPKGKAGE